MPLPIQNDQPSLVLTEAIALQGVFPSPNVNGSSMTLGMFHTYAFNYTPPGAPSANGQLLSISQNQALFAIMGTTFGGNGQTNFQLPNLTGRTAVDDGTGVGLNPVLEGQIFGNSATSLLQSQMPASSGGIANRFAEAQPSLGVKYLIHLSGVFPSPNGGGGSLDFLGAVVKFAGTYVPGGYAECDGQLLSIGNNTALFAILGTTYGGDGITTFALPDLRDRTIIGSGAGYSVGSQIGSDSVSLSQNNLPVEMGGLGLPIDNHQPSLVMNFAISLFGIFPSSSSGGADPDIPFVGEIITFAGNYAPGGTVLCQGQLLNIADYETLFNLIGTTYGGDGQTTFAVPDLTGRTVVGSGNAFVVGQTFGSNSTTISLDNIPDLNFSGTNASENLYGGNGTDIINGLDGNDKISGNGGIDTLSGGNGNDTLGGGGGNDLLIGGRDNDILTGGTGNDSFIFSLADLAIGQNDTITDCTRTVDGVGDKIALDGVAYSNISVVVAAGNATVSYGNGAITNTITVQNAGALPIYVNGYVDLAHAKANNLAGGYVYVSDATNQAAHTWLNYVITYNASGVNQYGFTNNDDGTRDVSNYDTTGVANFSSYVTSYNASNQFYYRVTFYRDNTYYTTHIDLTNQPWSSYDESYDAQNRLDYRYVINDDGSSITTHLDRLSNQPWKQYVENFDSLNRLDYRVTTNDDNSLYVTHLDHNNNLSWTSYIDIYNSIGQHTFESFTFDTGQPVITKDITYDNASQLWDQDIREYNAAHVQTLHYRVMDDLSIVILP